MYLRTARSYLIRFYFQARGCADAGSHQKYSSAVTGRCASHITNPRTFHDVAKARDGYTLGGALKSQ
jgi:hypothetical protein